MKICTKCKAEKPLGEFAKRKGMRDGLSSWCKTCQYAQTKNWYDVNKEKVKIYCHDNKDKRAENYRRWSLNNKDKVLAKVKTWQEANKGQYKEWMSNYITKYRADLNDGYVKVVLKQNGVTGEHIGQYPVLVELKRIQIKTEREIKNQII